MADYMRVKEAAKYLEVSPSTVRAWTNSGVLPTHRSVSNQRVFYQKDLDAFIRHRRGEPEPENEQVSIFYVRSSDGRDILMETQEEFLTHSYGEPDKIFRDKSSGLNENRSGLNAMLSFVQSHDNCVVHVTNKDRLTRFGFSYITRLIESYGGKVVVLHASETKEPFDVLMEDFMSLFASFSGKFYRLRGWEQQKKLVKAVSDNLDKK